MPINIDIVDKAISIVAKRNSGKSYLLRYLVKKQVNKFNKIFVICPILIEFIKNARFVCNCTIE